MTLFDGEGAHHPENNQGVQLLPNDVVLLCSDGLTDLVWNDEILEVVRSKPSLKEAARALVDLANERGGHDNITVVLISAPPDFKFAANKKKTDWLPWLLTGLAGIVVVAALASFVAFSMLRRNIALSFTQTVSPTSALTVTPMPSPTSTMIPAQTATPETLTTPLPTLTPWPTNTAKP